MHLDSAAFLLVFAAFFLLYSAAPSSLKRLLFVAGSVAFYASLSLGLAPLFLALGVFTFFVGARIHRETADGARDWLLWIGVGANVLTLALFKSAAPAGGAFATRLAFLARFRDVAVPLGMSFYTLQAISYVVDVHRRTYQPPRSLLSFLASFTLFPHLLSGPIVRSSFLVPLVERVQSPSWTITKRALFLFTAGLVKKSIADKLGPTADVVFDGTRGATTSEAWTGLLAYAAQLYGDFSGYTDMATALALLLGLDLPPNFNLPYLATSPADFWRRWHISLSTWLRDYVYLPLGVRLRRRPATGILITWAVAGLWHGVSWLFLIYGLYHGVLLALTDWLARRFEDDDDDVRGLRRVARTGVTFYLVLLGYVLFRARSIDAALRVLAELHWPHAVAGAPLALGAAAWVSMLAIVFFHALDYLSQRWRTVVERPWILWPAMTLAVTCLALFGGAAQPFIYFAF